MKKILIILVLVFVTAIASYSAYKALKVAPDVSSSPKIIVDDKEWVAVDNHPVQTTEGPKEGEAIRGNSLLTPIKLSSNSAIKLIVSKITRTSFIEFDDYNLAYKTNGTNKPTEFRIVNIAEAKDGIVIDIPVWTDIEKSIMKEIFAKTNPKYADELYQNLNLIMTKSDEELSALDGRVSTIGDSSFGVMVLENGIKLIYK